MWFAFALGFTALFSAWTGFLFLRMNGEKLGFWEKLPRSRTAGAVLGLIALLAFIPNVKPLFPPEKNLVWLIPAAVVLAFLCWRYLDHLFARAAAGAIILLVHWMLNESFQADLPGSSFFSLMGLAAGTYAIFIAAKPYWLRDSFRLMCRRLEWRLIGGIFSLLWSLSALILLVQQIGRIAR